MEKSNQTEEGSPTNLKYIPKGIRFKGQFAAWCPFYTRRKK